MTDTPKNDPPNGKTPTPKKRGGQPGNSNKTRHGLLAGKLPKGCQYIENRCNSLRRLVETQLIEVKGEVSFSDAAIINSILKWERHGLLAAHWMRHEAEKLSASERLKFSEAIAKASDNRDKNIRALGLDKPSSPWAELSNVVITTPTTPEDNDED